MGIGHVATTVNGDSVGRSSASFSHDGGSGGERGLFVCCKLRDDANAGVSGITFNGVALAKALDVEHEYTSGVWANVEWWYVVNPASGSNTLAVTYDQTLVADEITAVTLSGVDQGDPIGASSGTTGTGTGQSHSLVTEGDNSWVLGGIAKRRAGGGSFSPGTDVVELADGETGTAGTQDLSYWDGYKAAGAAGSVTVEATHSVSSQWTMGLIEVKEAGEEGVAVGVLAMHYRKL